MQRQFVFALFLVLSLAMKSQVSPAFNWVKQLGAGSHSFSSNKMAMDNSGNIYTIGSFAMNACDFDPGPGTYTLDPNDGNGGYFLMKMDGSGNFQWAKQLNFYPGADSRYLLSLDVSGNIYLAGSFSGTVDIQPGTGVHLFNSDSAGGLHAGSAFVLKLDNNANFLQVTQINAIGHSSVAFSGIFPDAIAVDADKNIYLTGGYSGHVDFDPGPATNILTSEINGDAYVLKLDSLGAYKWVGVMGSNGADGGVAIAVDDSGYVYSAGSFWGFVNDFDPGPGTYSLVGLGVGDSYISKLNKQGNFVWAKALSGPGMNSISALALDAQRNVYTTGGFADSVDFDPSPGWAYWLKPHFNSNDPSATSNMFISKLAANGDYLWAKSCSALSGDMMVTSPNGDVYVAGTFVDTVDFDPGPAVQKLWQSSYYATATGNSLPRNTYLLKLNHDGNFEYVINVGDNITYDIMRNAQDEIYATGQFAQKVDFDPSADSSIIVIPTPFPLNYTNGFLTRYGATVDGIKKNEGSFSTSIYPNPSADIFYIQVPDGISVKKAEVMNQLGERVGVYTNENKLMKLDLTGMPSGLYLLKLTDAKGNSAVGKIMKQ